MLNTVNVMGRLVRDPELRHTSSGTPVASFTLAVERDFATQGEERQADFIDIVAWRNTAEFVSKHFVKGQLVAVNGRIQTRVYEKDGNKRKATEIVCERVYFTGDNRGTQTAENSALRSTASSDGTYYSPVSNAFAELEGDDSDLPY